MKANNRARSTYLVGLLLMLVLWAVSGCRTQPAQVPTATPLPGLPTATVEQPTREPTSAPSPVPPTATVVQPTQGPTSTALPDPPRVTIDQVKQWMEQGTPLTFLDSRSAGDYTAAKSKIPGSLRVPPEDIEPHLSEIPRDRRIIAYCT